MSFRVFKRLLAKIGVQSIQTHIVLAFSCLILCIIGAMAFISYYVTGNVVEKNSSEYVYQLVEQVNSNIQYYLDNVETISQNIYANWDVQNYLSGDYSDDDYIEIDDKLAQYLDSFVASRSDILNIFIFTKDGRVVVNNPSVEINPFVDIENQLWYTRAMETDAMVISESRVQNIITGEYKWVISCSRVIKNFVGEPMGVLLIDLNYNLINDMVSQITLGKKGYVFIIDREGNIVYHPKQQLLYSNLKEEPIDTILDSEDGNMPFHEDGMKKQYTITTSDYSGWKVIGAVYIDDILHYRPILQKFFIIMGVFSLGISIFFSIIISRQILRPVRELADVMNKFEEGRLDVKINIKQKNEIGDLGKAFNLMIDQIKKLIRQNRMEQEQKRKNELKALQAQINPHFLYNTLDSIVWMAEAKKYEQVTTMTSALAKLFRISISKGDEFITIDNEIEHVVNYLKIQSIRYTNKFEYDIKIDENILKYMTVKLILQPVVENAIYHGIKNMVGPGTIEISGEEIDNRILLQIRDNGVGMTDDIIKKLFEKSEDQLTRLGGVGVRNVNERIKLYFGQEYGLEIESEPYEGTVVRIWIPVIRQRRDCKNEN